LETKSIIQFSEATILYGGKTALEEISLDIQEGELIGILGPNGSGKTTLLKAILGQIGPSSGSVQIFDCSCEKLRCRHRSRIGYLPQKGSIDPNFPLTVYEAVMMGRTSVIGLLRWPDSSDHQIVQQVLHDVGMETKAGIPLGQLSGGEQQRVFIARALAPKPEVLLLDEPTTGIDPPTQKSIIDLIRGLRKTLKLTILLVTHDINMISPIADRLALLNKRLVAEGPPVDILTPNTLTQVYGKEVVILNKNYVIVEDYHHA